MSATWALAGLLLGAGCSGGGPREDCGSIRAQAARDLQARWPTAGAARADPYAEDCVWYWSHKQKSVDGFGVTLVTLEAEPVINASLIILPDDQHATGQIDQPSLLFFDQTSDDWTEWPLIGLGYHYDFHPCRDPIAQCVPDDAWFIHEAGYHRSFLGDGGMDVATDADLVSGGPVDDAGCNVVLADDLKLRANTLRHGRHWDTHLWLDPAGGDPVFALADPWERWTDAPDTVFIEDDAFFYQDRGACGCE